MPAHILGFQIIILFLGDASLLGLQKGLSLAQIHMGTVLQISLGLNTILTALLS